LLRIWRGRPFELGEQPLQFGHLLPAPLTLRRLIHPQELFQILDDRRARHLLPENLNRSALLPEAAHLLNSSGAFVFWCPARIYGGVPLWPIENLLSLCLSITTRALRTKPSSLGAAISVMNVHIVPPRKPCRRCTPNATGVRTMPPRQQRRRQEKQRRHETWMENNLPFVGELRDCRQLTDDHWQGTDIDGVVLDIRGGRMPKYLLAPLGRHVPLRKEWGYTGTWSYPPGPGSGRMLSEDSS
jgi:hypothetical protein